MTTRIAIANRQRAAKVDVRALRAAASFFLREAAALAPAFRVDELSIALVDDAGIAPINELFLAHKGPTDVISFTYAGTATCELVLNVQRAVEESRRRGNPASRELALYLAHGCLHLAGYDDRTLRQRAAMQRIQQRWLRAATRAGLVLQGG